MLDEILNVVNCYIWHPFRIMQKKRIAIVTGGYSGEAEISYLSAKTIESHVDNSVFESIWVDITSAGWFAVIDDTKCAIDKNDFSFTHNGRIFRFDAAYIILHGTPGEDGKLQGYFDMIQLPYTGGGNLCMSLTFNKKFTTSALGNMGFRVAKSLSVLSQSDEIITQIETQLNLPLFVKPNNGGSSIGISKVKSWNELPTALEQAFKVDAQVLVEEALIGPECTVGIIEWDGKPLALPVTEIVSENEFFDYGAKYQKQSQEITPARFEQSILQAIKDDAEKIYIALGCKGICRVDYIITEQGPAIIEVNTIPGMSSESLIPQQLRAAGIDLTALISYQLNKLF